MGNGAQWTEVFPRFRVNVKCEVEGMERIFTRVHGIRV